MMKRNIFLSIGATIILFFSGYASADSTSSQAGVNGYNVGPLINSLVIYPGSTKLVTVYVQNTSNAIENVQTIVNNFVEAPSNDGTPELLFNNDYSKYGLKQFINVQNGNFILAPKQQEGVNVNITIPKDTESGGYFAAVRFAPQSAALGKNVNLSGSVASLMLITVPGNLHEHLNINKFGASDSSGHIHRIFTNHNSIYGYVYFNNSGNIQLQPFGAFDVHQGKNNLGNSVVNKGNGYILPGSQRYFITKLSGIGSFGRYTLYGNFGYGSRGELLSATATFYVVPIWIIWSFISLVVILILIIATYLRLYHRSK